MRAMRAKRDEQSKQYLDQGLQQTTSIDQALGQVEGAPPEQGMQFTPAGRAAYFFMSFVSEADTEKRNEAMRDLLGVLREANAYGDPQFFREFMGILPPEYGEVVRAGVGHNSDRLYADRFGDMLDIIWTAAEGRVGPDVLRRNNPELMDAVEKAKEALNVDLFRMLVSFDANRMLAQDFEGENFLRQVFSQHGIHMVGEERTVQLAFVNFINWLERVRGDREAILNALQVSYGVDLSTISEEERQGIGERMQRLAAALVHLATYGTETEAGGPRTVQYSKFVENLNNAVNMMRGDLALISSSTNARQLAGRIEAARRNIGYTNEVYGLLTDYLADYGVIGTRLTGPGGNIREIIGSEIGMGAGERRLSGTAFLFAAYERVGRSRGFFENRQAVVSQLNSVGVTVMEELPGTAEQQAGEAGLAEEATPEYGRGSRLFERLDLLGQYALVKNRESIFRFLERGEMPVDEIPEGEEGQMAQDARIRGAEYSAAYLSRLEALAGMAGSGTSYFMFMTAVPKIADYSEDYSEFNRLLASIMTGVDQITRPNSPYQVYGSQNALSAYLHLQVPIALRGSVEGGRGLVDSLAREVAQFPESEDFTLPPNLMVEPVLPRAGPVQPYRSRIRNYLDWGMGTPDRRFENLPLEFLASSFPTRMDIRRGFRNLSAMIPATLGLGTTTDNTAAALYALIASIRPEALYSQSELARFMTNEYENIVNFFNPPEGLHVTYHAGGRATYYRPIDLYARISRINLEVPPLVPAWIWAPSTGTASAGGTARGRAVGTLAEEVSGSAAGSARGEGPTVGGAAAAGATFQRGGTEASGGAEFHGPGMGASAMVQGIWYEEETDAAALARLNGMGADHDYAVLFDYLGKTTSEGEEGHLLRASTYMRFGGHWVRAGYYDVVGDADALRRFSDGFMSNLGEIGMLGYKYDEGTGTSGQITGAMSLTDPESFAGVGFSCNIADISALVGRYANMEGSHLASGGLGFLLGNGWSFGVIGRGAMLVDDENEHYGVVAMVDYNKNDTRFTASLGYDVNPVTYYMYDANRREGEQGDISLVSFPGQFISATLAGKTALSEARELELWLKTHWEVTEGETGGVSAGGVYAGRDFRVRATGSYEQWLDRRNTEGQDEIDWATGGGLEISWETEGGTRVAINLGAEYSTELLVDGRRVHLDQSHSLGRIFGHWEAFMQARDDMQGAQDAGDRDAETQAAIRASNSLMNMGYALKALARVREMSSGGLDSLREATDLMGAANVLIENSRLMVSARGAVVRGAAELESGAGEAGGGAGAGVRFMVDDTSITLSGDVGQAPSGAIMGGAYVRAQWAGGTDVAAAYSRNVWEEHGLKGFLQIPVGGRSTIGAQAAYTWGGVHGLQGMGSVGAFYARAGEEIDVSATVSGGWMGFAREEEGRRTEFEAWQAAAMVQLENAAWMAGAGVNIIGNLGGRVYEGGAIRAEQDIMGGGFFITGSYRDINDYIESFQGTFEMQAINGEYYITFKAGMNW